MQRSGHPDFLHVRSRQPPAAWWQRAVARCGEGTRGAGPGASRTHRRRTAPRAELVEQLSERELAVLRYLPTQLTQRDIATELHVSLNTVKSHSPAVYRKLSVVDRKSAVQAARDLHLL